MSYIEPHDDDYVEIPPDDKLPDVAGRNWLSDIELLKYLDEVDHECLVDGWLEQEGLGWVVAKSNTGKTNFIIDMAYHICSGHDWYGNKVKQGYVYYFALEGSKKGIAQKVQSIHTFKPEMFNDAFGRIRIDYDEFDLSQDTDTDLIIKEMNETKNKPSMIIFDALSEANQGARENNIDDMKAVFRRLRTIVKKCKCFVMVIHHYGKDAERGGRGGSNQYASLDTEISLEPTLEGFSCRDTKQRDLPKHDQPIYFVDKKVKIENEAGKKFSLIYIEEGQPSDPSHTPALNKIMAVVREHRAENIKLKRSDIERMTQQANVSRDVAKLIKNKQLKEDEERFIYLYSE